MWRTVGKIVVDGIDANLEQVKTGMAWHYKKYKKEQTLGDRSLYAQAEEQARGGKLGLWKDADPTRLGTGGGNRRVVIDDLIKM